MIVRPRTPPGVGTPLRANDYSSPPAYEGKIKMTVLGASVKRTSRRAQGWAGENGAQVGATRIKVVRWESMGAKNYHFSS
jgi:hypothetical protein